VTHSGIEVRDAWKRYRLRRPTLRDRLADLAPSVRRRSENLRKDFWALRDVSFRLEPGAALALVGENGSGKSTLLKLLAGMMHPTRGTVQCDGRLSMLSRLGSGFHDELTGQENVFLQGAILGIPPKNLASKLDRIFAFAEVERFADVPVKHYSAGMRLRLAFAIATHVDPEVLLIDEALAVGDAAFQDRCLDQIARFRESGVTMVFVSHSRYFIEQLCSRAILLHRGEMIEDGPPPEVFTSYERVLARDHPLIAESSTEGDVANAPLTLESIELVGHAGQAEPVLAVDQALTVRLGLRANRDVTRAAVGLQVAREWHVLHGTRSNRHGVVLSARRGERVCIDLEYRSLNLMAGLYHLHVLVLDSELAMNPTVSVKRAARFRITHGATEGVGLVRLAHTWRTVG
jgi:ABC-type polysaccharide/polyol phosphate transport system ATPase subunit